MNYVLWAVLLAAIYIGARFGSERRNYLRSTLPVTLGLGVMLVAWTGVEQFREHRRHVAFFRANPPTMMDGDQVIQGVHSPDRTEVTNKLPSGRSVTVERVSPW